MKAKYIYIFPLLLIAFACKKSTEGTTNQMPTINSTTLLISKSKNLAEPRISLSSDTIYSDLASGPLFKNLPAGWDNEINSIYIPKGYMATFAENSDGSGESSCYVATESSIQLNFSPRLANKVSYVRYIPVNNVTKKGIAYTDSNIVKQFTNAEWYYGWSLNRPSFPGISYVPMTWGRLAASIENVNYLADRKDVNHLLSFNEPDNASQANIPNIDTAINRYRIMMRTGLRLGSPAVEQNNAIAAGRWLPNFMAAAKAQKLRVDFICLHWYDWGNQTQVLANDTLTAEAIFGRFRTYIQNARAAYPDQTIWITEYNCNPSRNSRPNVMKHFMRLSTEWLNTQPYVERYCYFQFNNEAIGSNGLLNDIALFWNSLSSPKSFLFNID